MAKKVRRVRRSAAPKNNSEAAPSEVEARELGQRQSQNTPTKASDLDLEEEYAYVMQDLRRVFILAVLLFILLIALNLILG